MSAQALSTDGGTAAEAAPFGAKIDLSELVDAVLKRWRLAVPAFGLAFGCFLAYLLLAPTLYSASMALLIDPRDRPPAGVDAQPFPQNPDPALVESQMRALTSKAVLRRVVDALDLVREQEAERGLLDLAMDAAGALFGGAAGGPDAKRDAAAEALGKRITLKRAERSYVLDVDVAARTGEKAVRNANALAEAYFANQAALGAALTQKQSQWLDGRVADLKQKLDAAGRRVQEFRDTQAIPLTPGASAPAQRLGAANEALVAARGKRAEVEARLQQLQSAAAGHAGVTADDQASPVIARLKQDFAALARDEANQKTVLGPRHPSYLATLAQLQSVQEQIRAERLRIVEAATRELRAAEAAERSAERLVAKSETATNALGDKSVDLAAIEGEAATLRAAYEKAVSASENVRRDAVQSPLVTLVDPPVADPARSSPKRTAAAFAALAGGFNLWVVFALVSAMRERRRAAAQAPPVAARAAAAPVRRPAFAGDGREGADLLARCVAMPAGAAADADGPAWSRALGALVGRIEDFAGQGDQTRRLVFAALGPGDPSTVALRLAYREARAGRQVMVGGVGGELARLARALASGSAPRHSGLLRAFADKGGGAAYVADPARPPAGDALDGGAFDSALLCARSLGDAAAVLRAGAADALVLVAPQSVAPDRLAAALAALGLTGSCAAVAVVAEAGRSRRAA